MEDNKDLVAEEIANALEKLDGRQVAMKFTIHGEVMLIQAKGKQVEVPLEVDKLKPEPKGFHARHKDIMGIIYTAVCQIAENPVRIVPVTRNELTKQWGVSAKLLKQLERWGYLRQRVIKLVPKDDPKATKGQAVAIYYFTPQGRAYVRREFDPQYGLSAPVQCTEASGASSSSSDSASERLQPEA